MDGSAPGLPVHHHLPEFTQIQVHQVGDAIQPSHPLLALSLPALNIIQHQGLKLAIVCVHLSLICSKFQGAYHGPS